MKKETWVQYYWRSAMAWQYMAVCLFDFIIFPALSMYLKNDPWEPLTLKESGFYHLAMSAIVGVAAWTRGQEKIKRILTGSDAVEETTEKTTITQTPKAK